MFEIGQLTRLPLGYVGESGTRTISIDMKAWLDEYPGALIMIQVIRPVDHYKYPAVYTKTDGVIHWTVDGSEVMYAGKGLAQIALYNPDTKQEYKSRVVGTIVAESLDGFNDILLEETDPASKWVNQVLEAAESAEASKNDAANSKEEAAAAIAIVATQKNEALIAIQNEGAAQVVAVNDAGTQQAQFVEAKGEEVLGKIPEDYTELSNNVTALTQDIARNTAPAIIPTATGSIVTITDGAARPAVEVISHIEPVQEGEGDPSPDNVRPISGWTKAEAYNTGYNFFPDVNITIDGVTIAAKNGRVNVTMPNRSEVSSTRGEWQALKLRLPGKTLCKVSVFDEKSTITGWALYTFKSPTETEPILSYGEHSASAWLDDEYWLGMYLYNATGSTGTLSFDIVLTMEDAQTSTFVPANPQQILSASLPETVYGGKLDWLTGVLTVETVIKEYNGSNGTWTPNNGTQDTLFYLESAFVRGAILCCSHAPVRAGIPRDNIGVWSNPPDNYSVHLNLGVLTDAEGFAALLASSPVQIVYKLDTPYTVQLSPYQLSTLKGINNVWSDCGDTTISYIADTKLYIDQKIAAIAAATL